MLKNRQWLWVVPILLTWAAILAVYGGFVEDDAFISFRYARNLATGQGFTYNPGEVHFGTSAPLFAALLGLLGIPHPDSIPAAGFWISAVALLACGLAMLAFWWDGKREIGLLAGVLIVASPLAYYSLGMEMSTQAALVLWGFFLCRIGRPARGMALLSLAVLVRPDAVVALSIGLAYAAWRRRDVPWRELGTTALFLLPAAAILYAYFGTALPATAAAKQAQVESGIWRTFIPGTLNFLQEHYVAGRHMPIAPIASETVDTPLPLWPVWIVLTLIGVFHCRRAALPLIWAGGITLAYQVGRVTFNDWYIFPVGMGVSVLAACGLSKLPARAVMAFAGAASLFLVWYAWARALNCRDGRKLSYIQAGNWLAQNTEPTDTVGFCELGYVGWYGNRTMVDPLGLVHEGLDSHVAAGNFGYAYKKRRPDYILDCPVFNLLFVPDHTLEWLRASYVPVAEFRNPGYPPVTVWKREGPNKRAATIVR